MNWALVPALCAALLLFAIAQAAWPKAKGALEKAALTAIAVALAAPALLYCLYYAHLFDSWSFFIELRAAQGSELLAGGCGFAFGIASLETAKAHWLARPLALGSLCAVIALPYAKPLLAPLKRGALRELWQGEACLQSSSSTCGPASAASVLRKLGIEAKESEIAKDAFSYQGGTESWHLIRAMRARGAEVEVETERELEKPFPAPCVAGVRLGGVGHFIAILEETSDGCLAADPLVGPRRFSKDELLKRYSFTGFFIEASRR